MELGESSMATLFPIIRCFIVQEPLSNPSRHSLAVPTKSNLQRSTDKLGPCFRTERLGPLDWSANGAINN